MATTMTEEVLRPDLCVIGAGSAGLSVAAAAGLMGVPVALVERGRMGGDCLNVGCVPSKALIAAGERAQAARDAKAFGVGLPEPRIDFARVHRHVHEVIAAIAPNDSVERFRALGVDVIAGEARFVDPRTLAVAGRTIRARRFVIATGSSPAVPPIPGLEATPYFTNETIFDLTERPRHLIVLGGGPIGCELAQAFRRLGAAVTILSRGRLLPREDGEAAAVVETALLREGVALRPGVAVRSVSADAEGVAIALEGADEPVRGSHLLVAVGRRVVTDGLGLEAAGVRRNEAGIVVDRGMRTANRRIYAIGDCAGGPQFTHAANYHAGLVIRSALFRMPVKADYAALPRVTFTDPEVAAVGMSEAEALATGKGVSILRWPFSENDRAQAERRTEGFVKIFASPKGRVLGATIVGPRAGELIAPFVLMIAKRLPVTALTEIVIPYPTLSEVAKRAAITFLTPRLRSPWLPRILAFLRRFG
jgi:pyruvate/2-oxoglutarate dehydrogenase complex dihydrolipoamide dehydrogenase (E3) component